MIIRHPPYNFQIVVSYLSGARRDCAWLIIKITSKAEPCKLKHIIGAICIQRWTAFEDASAIIKRIGEVTDYQAVCTNAIADLQG